jgi:phosphohistidine phosphatase
MKRVLIVRHAKSSWDDISVPDFDRPLNDRGKHDAPMMAKRLAGQKVDIDAFISSPAKRAKKTASLFAKEFGQHKHDLILVDALYHAGVEEFYQAIEQAPNKAKTIALFSHNPGITDFVNTLTDTRVDDMPTCAVFAVKAPIEKWSEFRDARREFWFFDFPKNEH